KGNFRSPLAAQIRVRSHRVVEKLEAQDIESVRPSTRIEDIARQHRIEIETGEVDPQRAKEQEIEFRVVCRLADCRILEKAPERLHFRSIERGKVPDF